MLKNDGFFKMRTGDDLLFGRNESQRHVWRPVGGRGWTTFTSNIVVLSNLGDDDNDDDVGDEENT